jgi:hypothetical protein
MSKDESKEKMREPVKHVSWDELIADAQREISSNSLTIKRLQESIRFFRDKKEAGCPFPSDG